MIAQLKDVILQRILMHIPATNFWDEKNIQTLIECVGMIKMICINFRKEEICTAA